MQITIDFSGTKFFIASIGLWLAMSSLRNEQPTQNTNFSGTWTINEQKSKFGEAPVATMFKQIKVVQSKDTLTVYGMRFSDTAISSKATSYPLNGNAVKTVLSNNRTMTAILKWSDDGKILTRSSTYSLESKPDETDYESVEVWSLSADEKILTLTRTFIRTAGSSTVKAVYEKL